MKPAAKTALNRQRKRTSQSLIKQIKSNQAMKQVVFLLSMLFLSGCLSSELVKLASEYSASITFFDHAQKNFRKIYSDCSYEKDCFEDRATDHLELDLCPMYQDYKFVSKTECERAGQSVMDLVLGKTELAVPIRNKRQDAHNDRMYELERERLELEKQRDKDEREKERCLSEMERQTRKPEPNRNDLARALGAYAVVQVIPEGCEKYAELR